MKDIRVALRRFARDPLSTVVVVATLAIGIGLNAAVFSVVDAVLLDDLPVAEPDRLFKIVQTRTDRGGHYSVNSHSFLAWRDRQHTFQDLAAMTAFFGLIALVLAGLALAAGLAPLLAEQLFGVEPTDGTIYTVGAFAICFAAAMASWLPARRALAVDPSRVLRDE